jgi:predicted O-methyltransferase YrrM
MNSVTAASQISNRLIRTWFAKLETFVVQRNLRRIGVAGAHQIPTLTSRQELHALYYLARNCSPGSSALEIGSYLGASTCYLAAGMAKVNGQLFCVDTWQNETMPDGMRDTLAEFMENTRGAQPWLKIVRKRSEQLIEADVAIPLDLVFIDGDHSYQAVHTDFQRTSPWLSREGTIAFHDSLYYEGVARTIGEALVTGEWAVVGCVGNLCWIKRAKPNRSGGHLVP